MPTARQYLISELEAHLDRFWKVIPTQRTIDQIDKVSVIVKQTTIGKAPEARSSAAGVFLVDFVVTVVSPKADFDAAEKQLDDKVLRLIQALNAAGNVRWTDAKKVVVGPNDRYLGYDLTIQVLDKQGA